MLAKLVVGLDGGVVGVGGLIKTKEEATSALNSGQAHLFAWRSPHALPTSWQPHVLVKG